MKSSVYYIHYSSPSAAPETEIYTAYTFHAYGRSEGLAGIIISDHEYPALVAHQLLSKVVDEFLQRNPRSTFANAASNSIVYPQLKEYITKYQDPAQADSIMKVQKELDETKITLHKTIESVLERNVKLDDLVNKSEGLSSQSRMFYTQVGHVPLMPFGVHGTGLTFARIGKKAELLLYDHVTSRDFLSALPDNATHNETIRTQILKQRRFSSTIWDSAEERY